jgi:hypothetical protein
VSDPGYIVYIDEAGDFGLRSVVPVDPTGASEWLVMGAMVVRRENELMVPSWLKTIRHEAKNNQSIDLHFRKLSDRQKRIICAGVAKLPLRLFVVVSNKQNMRQHKNPSASYVSQHKHWFYWWVSRLVLERVTDFCAAQNKIHGTPDRKLRIEFSRRRDLKRHEFTDYFTRLWLQKDAAFLNKRTINWSVFDFNEVYFYDHKSRAGLQFADVVASSFFQAVNIHPHGSCCADYAKMLEPRIHQRRAVALDEGFTVWPYSLADLSLTAAQKDVFRYYKYPEKRLTK